MTLSNLQRSDCSRVVTSSAHIPEIFIDLKNVKVDLMLVKFANVYACMCVGISWWYDRMSVGTHRCTRCIRMVGSLFICSFCFVGTFGKLFDVAVDSPLGPEVTK